MFIKIYPNTLRQIFAFHSFLDSDAIFSHFMKSMILLLLQLQMMFHFLKFLYKSVIYIVFIYSCYKISGTIFTKVIYLLLTRTS